MTVLYRPHRGSLSDSLAELKKFGSLKEMFEFIAADWSRFGNCFSVSDLSVHHYGYDSAFGCESYVVTTRRMKDLIYEVPQAVGFCSFTE